MAKRLCAFCPSLATTGEHCWPDWVNRILGEKRRYIIRQGKDRSWQTVGLRQKFPVLCDPCNNEWGSDIEARMRDVSSSMVKSGDRKLLDREDILAIHIYSQLKAFVCDYAQEEVESFYGPGERRAFRSDLTFPSGTSIWLARTDDDHGVFDGAYAKPPLNTSRRFHTYIFMTSLGQLVIQLTSVRWTKKSNRKFADPPLLTQDVRWDSFSIPIYPKVRLPVNWPPQHQLVFEDLKGFFERWQKLNRTDGF
jgi:hypothetical protein